MGVPWGKIGKGILKGFHIGAQFDPRLAMIDGMINGVEEAIEEAGPDKKKRVELISDAVLDAELLHLPEETQAIVKQARSAYIDAYVALRNAEARTRLAAIAFKAAMDAAHQERAEIGVTQ